VGEALVISYAEPLNAVAIVFVVEWWSTEV
jgi:hypothetical protein